MEMIRKEYNKGWFDRWWQKRWSWIFLPIVLPPNHLLHQVHLTKEGTDALHTPQLGTIWQRRWLGGSTTQWWFYRCWKERLSYTWSIFIKWFFYETDRRLAHNLWKLWGTDSECQNLGTKWEVTCVSVKLYTVMYDILKYSTYDIKIIEDIYKNNCQNDMKYVPTSYHLVLVEEWVWVFYTSANHLALKWMNMRCSERLKNGDFIFLLRMLVCLPYDTHLHRLNTMYVNLSSKYCFYYNNITSDNSSNPSPPILHHLHLVINMYVMVLLLPYHHRRSACS